MFRSPSSQLTFSKHFLQTYAKLTPQQRSDIASSWFLDRADQSLEEFQVARAASDPVCVLKAADTGGLQTLAYFRLH
jgi:hypothetical protein